MKDRKIKLACPACERKLKMGDNLVGKPIVCPKCNTRFKINNSMVAEILGRGHHGSNSTIARQDKEIVGEPSEVKAAFEDIDSLFTSKEIDSHVQQIETHASNSEKLKVSRSDVASEWQKEKRVVSRSDERLRRNGVGLLILAAGLAVLPIFGASVPELTAVLPYLPIAALTVAVIGTFFLTYSKRRRGFGSIILSLFPLIFICLAAAGGYVYLEFLNPGVIEESKAPAAKEPGVLDPAADGLDANPENDLITIDRDSINQNPAAKFVPPKHDELSGDHKPSLLAESDLPERNPNRGELVEANTTDSQSHEVNENDLTPNPSAFEPPESNQVLPPGTDKREALLNRIADEQMKALVSRGEFRGPGNDSRYTFSRIAGETTVYGFALKSDATVRGFDFLIFKENPTVELVVPVSQQPQFVDSVVDEAQQELVGVNIHRQAIGIVGLQAVFTDGSDTTMGDWIGLAPEADNYMTLRSEPGKLAGFVMYRSGLRTVGFGLVTRQ